jgi:transposase
VCLDKAYDFLDVQRESVKRRYIPRIYSERRRKRIDKDRYATKRWVVERTNSWHNRFRKLLLIRYEKKSENYPALASLACRVIVYRRIILGYALS